MSMMLSGEVARGGRYASGLHEPERPNETGTIALQRSWFVAAGVESAKDWFTGTINIAIAPNEFMIMDADYIVLAEWLPGVFEKFLLVGVMLRFKNKLYPAHIYYPCPSDLKAHPDSIVEVLAREIPDLHYGDTASVLVPDGKVILKS
jgi:hypothetical protein